MIKMKFDQKFSHDSIVECLTSTDLIEKWNKSVMKSKSAIRFSSKSMIVHTVLAPSFLLDKREFIEKRFLTTVKQSKAGDIKTLVYKSSVPEEFLGSAECKILGTNLFSLTVIKYNSEKDRTCVTIFEQTTCGLKSIDRLTKALVPSQVDKMYRNLIEYLSSNLKDDCHSL